MEITTMGNGIAAVLDEEVVGVGRRIELPEIRRPEVLVPIIGITPLVQHAWSEKAREQLRESGKGALSGPRIKKVKENDTPQKQADDSTYWLASGQPGFPAAAFKGAMVKGVRIFGGKDAGLPMTELRPIIWVRGEGPQQLVPLDAEWEMVEDIVRIGRAQTSPRYRNYFSPWRAVLRIGYVEGRIDQQSVIRLVQAAGIGGVGEWRAEKTSGNYGSFEIDLSRPVTTS